MDVFTCAAVYFIDAAAFIAVKMVMVVLAGFLVAQPLSGQFYGFEQSVFGQVFYAAIDGGDAEIGKFFLSFCQYLLRRKRAVRLFNYSEYNFSLLGIPPA